MLRSIKWLLPAIVLMILSIQTSSVWGQEKPELSDMELIERVTILQRELESPEVSKRDAAEKELIELGVRVLDYLEPTTKKTPTDAVERTNRVRQALEKIAVASVTKASLVTLKGSCRWDRRSKKFKSKPRMTLPYGKAPPTFFVTASLN